MSLLQEVVKPHKAKTALKRVQVIVDKIKNEIKTKNIKADVIIGGSVAKGTNLKNFDCDIFVRFNRKYQDGDLSGLLEKILKCFQKKKRVHGSRDYFKFEHKNIEYEIIPVLNIPNSSKALNVTDVSPLHVVWVQKHIKKLGDDIKLAKLFCKAQGIYGAESFINGFSGYMLEILVIHYGGFIKFLKGISQWKPKKVIDYSKFYKNQKEVFQRMNRAKLESPLILIDPVQKERNAAAALSNEKFSILIATAKGYLIKPSKKFFKAAKFSLICIRKKTKKNKAELVLLESKPVEGKRDIVGSKLLKCFNKVKKHLELNKFQLIDAGWNWNEKKNKALMWYIIYPKKLPRYIEHQGPLVYSNKQDIKKFTAKHKTYKIKNDRMYTNIRRKFTKPKRLVQAIIKKYFSEKVKKTKLLGK